MKLIDPFSVYNERRKNDFSGVMNKRETVSEDRRQRTKIKTGPKVGSFNTLIFLTIIPNLLKAKELTPSFNIFKSSK